MKKILSLVSVLTIIGAPILALNTINLHDIKNDLEITNFKTKLTSNAQIRKLEKRETNIHQKNVIFFDDFELETPVTKVTAFYIKHSDQNTFIWTKKLPTKQRINFNIRVKNNTNYWAEGLEFNHFNKKLNLPLNYTISLEDNSEYEQTLVEKRYVAEIGNVINSRTINVVNSKLILNLQYSNNVITARFTARATAQNTSLFSWVKTQAKFYFKIVVSKNELL